jgi:thioredoxin reductase (NADPH)
VRQVPTTAVFVMIGADPCTEAAQGMLALDPPATCCAAPARRAARPTWLAARRPRAAPAGDGPPGVFAAGDVRAGASNRVAGAVGDGAMVVRFAHDVLDGA